MQIGARNAILGSGNTSSGRWEFYFEAREANSTVAMSSWTDGTHTAPAVTLEYTIDDGANWLPFVANTTTVTLADAGSRVYLRAGAGGNTHFAEMKSDRSVWFSHHSFVIGGSLNVGGKLLSLFNGEDETLDIIPAPPSVAGGYACSAACLFRAGVDYGGTESASVLVDASALVIPSNLSGSYSAFTSMFNGCTSLTAAPALLATTLATRAYGSMFYNCRALATPPPALPATTMANECYGRMFYGCAALQSAPALPATAVSVYRCYWEMFRGCTRLDALEVAFTSWPSSDAITNWLYGVYRFGTFRCPAALGMDATIARGASACPARWTVVNTQNAEGN